MTARDTVTQLFLIDGSSFVQENTVKKLYLVGEMKRVRFTMVELSALFPVAKYLSLEVNRTSVTWLCSGAYYQLLRAAEPDQCVSKVKTKPIHEMPAQRQRDILELRHLLPISWYSVCVCVWKGRWRSASATTGFWIGGYFI